MQLVGFAWDRPIINTGIAEEPTDQPKAEPRTVICHGVPEQQLDNCCILASYRTVQAIYREIPYQSHIFAQRDLHNVYIHLIGALVLPAIAIASLLSTGSRKPQFLHVSRIVDLMFGIFSCGANGFKSSARLTIYWGPTRATEDASGNGILR